MLVEVAILPILTEYKVSVLPIVRLLPEAEDLNVDNDSCENDHQERKGHFVFVVRNVQNGELDHIVFLTGTTCFTL